MNPWLSIVLVTFLCVVPPIHAEDYLSQPWPDIRDMESLIRRADVQNELKLSPQQRHDAHFAIRAASSLFDQINLELPIMTSEDLSVAVHRVQAKTLEAATATLTPDQIKRLKQLTVQYQIANGSMTEVLDKTIELTAEQRMKLKEAETKLASEGKQMMWDFYRSYQAALVRDLTQEQRATWRTLTGEEFPFTTSYWGLGVMGGGLR